MQDFPPAMIYVRGDIQAPSVRAFRLQLALDELPACRQDGRTGRTAILAGTANRGHDDAALQCTIKHLLPDIMDVDLLAEGPWRGCLTAIWPMRT